MTNMLDNEQFLSYHTSPAKMTVPTQDPYADDIGQVLLGFMRGTQITIPNLEQLTCHWPSAVHPEIDRLEKELYKTLEWICSSPGTDSRPHKMNWFKVPQYGASCFPSATSFDTLLIGSLFTTWLFAWDHETDCHKYSSLFDGFEKSCAFRRETMSYLEACLLHNADPARLASISTNPIVTSFKPIADVIISRCTEAQVMRFMDELRFFIDMSEEEHMFEQINFLPTVDEYMRRRMGSCAVRACLAMQEYVLGINIPQEVMQSEPMKTIWHEVNVIISVENDLLSVKKEVDQSRVHSLIPLLSLQLGSVPAAVNYATDMIRASIRSLEAAENMLLQMHASNPDLHDSLVRFITACKYTCTGNLSWNLNSGRYKLGNQPLKGSFTIVL